MKNIYLLPTDKPSSLFAILQFDYVFDNQNKYHEEYKKLHGYKNKNIYITSDEEIKEWDWFIANQKAHKCIRVDSNTSCPFITLNNKGEEIGHFKTWRTKIILTTDQDLINDGVQAIDEDFLEWFVKNPNCEEVMVKKEKVILGVVSGTTYYDFSYKIIIPQEELGQDVGNSVQVEPLEDFIKKAYLSRLEDYLSVDFEDGVKLGAKWQQEQDKNKYSEEEVYKIQEKWDNFFWEQNSFNGQDDLTFKDWFEQFKKQN